MFREKIAVCCQQHTEHTDALCWQNAVFLNAAGDGKYSYHFALRVNISPADTASCKQNMTCQRTTNNVSSLLAS